jgi:cyclopropane-fatty-acyl-phospholipid synthase
MSTSTAPDCSVAVSLELLDELTADYPHRDFSVRLWNGDTWGSVDRPRFTLVLNHADALRHMLLGANQVTLGEAFVYGGFDVEGDIEEAFEFGDYLLTHQLELTEKLRLAGLLLRLPRADRQREGGLAPHLHGRLHSKNRDREAVTYHYDLSNDFFQLWLDRRMVYSCAYFKRGDEDLDTAQAQKLDYLCRKLRLRPGQSLLDIGCGWGGLVLYAAQHFGARALGVTLSRSQAELAQQRIAESGLSERCEVRVCDYRDLDPALRFDKIVSVGMFEHVGEDHLLGYFQHVWKLLRTGGVFMNHGIAASATFHRQGPSFIDKYVFPDGGLVPLGTTVRIAEACGFEVRDVESLREHYARTLRHWVSRLQAHGEEARRIAGDVLYRVWRIYMLGSAHNFAKGRINLYQVLFSKPEDGHTYLPLNRADWYA